MLADTGTSLRGCSVKTSGGRAAPEAVISKCMSQGLGPVKPCLLSPLQHTIAMRQETHNVDAPKVLHLGYLKSNT